MVKQAVIPVAGKGTRFLPATKEIAKEMIPILKKPMIHYVVEEAVESGIEEIVLVTSREKEEVEKYFKPNGTLEKFLAQNNKEQELELIKKIGSMVEIKTVVQDQQLGLGHAINCARALIDQKPFAVLLADDIIMSKEPVTLQLINKSQEYDMAPVIGVMNINRSQTSRYGIVAGTEITQDILLMDQMVEKPEPNVAPTTLATPGRYILPFDIFDILDHIPKGAGGEYQLTDGINELCKQHKVYAHTFKGTRYDTGSIEGYLEATIDFALADSKLREVLMPKLRKIVQG